MSLKNHTPKTGDQFKLNSLKELPGLIYDGLIEDITNNIVTLYVHDVTANSFLTNASTVTLGTNYILKDENSFKITFSKWDKVVERFLNPLDAEIKSEWRYDIEGLAENVLFSVKNPDGIKGFYYESDYTLCDNEFYIKGGNILSLNDRYFRLKFSDSESCKQVVVNKNRLGGYKIIEKTITPKDKEEEITFKPGDLVRATDQAIKHNCDFGHKDEGRIFYVEKSYGNTVKLRTTGVTRNVVPVKVDGKMHLEKIKDVWADTDINPGKIKVHCKFSNRLSRESEVNVISAEKLGKNLYNLIWNSYDYVDQKSNTILLGSDAHITILEQVDRTCFVEAGMRVREKGSFRLGTISKVYQYDHDCIVLWDDGDTSIGNFYKPIGNRELETFEIVDTPKKNNVVKPPNSNFNLGIFIIPEF